MSGMCQTNPDQRSGPHGVRGDSAGFSGYRINKVTKWSLFCQLSLVRAPTAMYRACSCSIKGATPERGVPRTPKAVEAGGDTSPPILFLSYLLSLSFVFRPHPLIELDKRILAGACPLVIHEAHGVLRMEIEHARNH